MSNHCYLLESPKYRCTKGWMRTWGICPRMMLIVSEAVSNEQRLLGIMGTVLLIYFADKRTRNKNVLMTNDIRNVQRKESYKGVRVINGVWH